MFPLRKISTQSLYELFSTHRLIFFLDFCCVFFLLVAPEARQNACPLQLGLLLPHALDHPKHVAFVLWIIQKILPSCVNPGWSWHVSTSQDLDAIFVRTFLNSSFNLFSWLMLFFFLACSSRGTTERPPTTAWPLTATCQHYPYEWERQHASSKCLWPLLSQMTTHAMPCTNDLAARLQPHGGECLTV
jgi:hypothetical protein